MGYKMKGCMYSKKSPLKQKKKTVVGENTDDLKRDKKGNSYALNMYDQADGINKGDTIFAPDYKIPTSYGYIEGGDYDATETKSSKKRKKGPKSYTIKTK